MTSRAPEPQPRPAPPANRSPEDALMERLVTLAIAWREAQTTTKPAADVSPLRKAS